MKNLMFKTVITCLYLASISAEASIISVSGSTSIIAPPVSVVDEQLISEFDAFLFAERQGVLLAENLYVTANQSGSYTGTNGPSDPSALFIAAGTTVDSYYLHMDTVNSVDAPNDISTKFKGTINFNTAILGVAFEEIELGKSHSVLGASTTTYSAIVPDGLEDLALNPLIGDVFTISDDRLSLTYNFAVTTHSDNIRIITEVTPVPVPAGLWLFLSGIIGLAGIARANK